MNHSDKQYNHEHVTLKGLLSEFREALEEEIEKIKKDGQSSTLLYAGKQIERYGTDFWYQFRVEYAPAIPADTPCKLFIGEEQFDVTVINFEEDTITIVSKIQLPDIIGKVRLENGTTVLMELLIKCIEENSEKENKAGNRMLSSNGEIYSAKKIFSYNDIILNAGNTQSQNQAIVAALENDITYIWGPPGTGKTTVIGQIIDQLYKHGRSVLVVSHTNTAVDGAIEKIDKIYSKIYQDKNLNYPILRLGNPEKVLPDRVLLNSHVAKLGKILYLQKSELEKWQLEKQNRVNDIGVLLAKNIWLEENKLSVIQKELLNLSEQEFQERRIQSEIDSANVLIQKEKETHPEYSQYFVVEKDIKKKKLELEVLTNRLWKGESCKKELQQEIEKDFDEIKKHDKYVELQKEEAKYMSVQFLQGELSKISGKLSSLQLNIMILNGQRDTNQQAIAEYEKRGVIAKFFSGKRRFTEAQSNLQKIGTHLLQVEGDLQRQQKLEQEYKRQLESLLLLQERKKVVTPSETKIYWEREVLQKQERLALYNKKIGELSKQKDRLIAQLNTLELWQNERKDSFQLLCKYGKELEQNQGEQRLLDSNIREIRRRCLEAIAREYLLCSAFSDEPKGMLERDFEELFQLLAMVKKEMEGVNSAALEKEKESAEEELIEISRQLSEINRKIQELEKQAIVDAKIIGTTLAKSYLSETLRERTFDTVILDEASMASIPALWCASYLAENSIVIVGDFLQLSPIVQAGTSMAQKWLGKDIFYHSGMQDKARNRETCPTNFVMLNEQFRMERDIAALANMYYGEYGGLQTNDTEYRQAEREVFYKWYSGKRTKENIHLVDTESLNAWVTGIPRGKGQSRLNCFSAAVDIELAFKLLENKLDMLDRESATPVKEALVLIVAPYKPHVERLKRLIEQEYKKRGFKENLNYVRTGTIHSFQGSEADIVIFDLVIDKPHWKANLFMPDENSGLRKMFNVAITRAKFKLYIVGNFAYCQKRAKNNTLALLLDKLLEKDRLVKLNAKELLRNITFSKQIYFSISSSYAEKDIICREETFNDYFVEDIHTFKKRLIIYSPFITGKRLSVLLPLFADAISAGKQIVVITKDFSDRHQTDYAQYQKYEKEMKDIGISIFHKKGMHEKLIFVDTEVVWIGSLNALSFTGLTGEIMRRQTDSQLALEYEKIFNIPYICAAVANNYEQKCPICGNEMLVKESAHGGIYWECVKGDYFRSMTQPYPIDGLLRCKKCGALYEFSMKNEPRWVCSRNPKHYQQMKESDLKFEKMAALIPKEVQKDVKCFLEQKWKKDKVEMTIMSDGKSGKANEDFKLEESEQVRLF